VIACKREKDLAREILTMVMEAKRKMAQYVAFCVVRDGNPAF
jgi:hypothetical protein